MTYTGETWGASWGDYDGDGLPDLFLSNHRAVSSIFHNNGDHTFTDEVVDLGLYPLFTRKVGSGDYHDTHGSGWGDFDNDGDQDLMFVSTWSDSALLRNDNGSHFTDVTAAWGTPGSGIYGTRDAAWFDFNFDGKPDVYMPSSSVNSTLYRQGNGTFVDTNSTLEKCDDGQYAQVSDIDVDGVPDFICEEKSLFPGKIYGTTTSPFTDKTALFPRVVSAQDSVIADLDGDLRPDVFVLVGYVRPSDAVLVGNNRVEAEIHGGDSREKSFRFNSAGKVTLELGWTSLEADPARINRVWIGAGSRHPTSDVFTLDPGDPTVAGIRSHNVATDNGIYIGYIPATQQWQVVVSPGGTWVDSSFVATSTSAISNLAVTGRQSVELSTRPVLYMNRSVGFQESAAAAGLGPVSCISAVAGDFDNDMDQDLFLTCRNGASNIADQLYENLGNGTFAPVANAAGAAGVVGPEFSSGAGASESVVTADYDADGFLDLLVTNGLNLTRNRVGGPYQLFRNGGNANHWIELDLEGVDSNRDGVGAKVFATAGGKVQLREQNGGYHRWSQNHPRVHFGLAGNSTVTELRVEWPNGPVDTIPNVAADRIYRVTEGGTIVALPIGGGNPPPPPSPCGQPTYDKTTEAAVFVWQDCTTQIWNTRVTGGSQTLSYDGNVEADQALVGVTPFSVESSDLLDNSTPSTIAYSLKVAGSGQDGYAFTVPNGASACLTLTSPTLPVYLGSVRAPMPASFDLTTLGACN